jgi:hypothetical protein
VLQVRKLAVAVETGGALQHVDLMSKIVALSSTWEVMIVSSLKVFKSIAFVMLMFGCSFVYSGAITITNSSGSLVTISNYGSHCRVQVTSIADNDTKKAVYLDGNNNACTFDVSWGDDYTSTIIFRGYESNWKKACSYENGESSYGADVVANPKYNAIRITTCSVSCTSGPVLDFCSDDRNQDASLEITDSK